MRQGCHLCHTNDNDATFKVDVNGELKWFHIGCVNHIIREFFKKDIKEQM